MCHVKFLWVLIWLNIFFLLFTNFTSFEISKSNNIYRKQTCNIPGNLSIRSSNNHTCFHRLTLSACCTGSPLDLTTDASCGCNLLMLTCRMNIYTCPAFCQAHGIIHCVKNQDLKCHFRFPSSPYNGSSSVYVLVYLILQKWHVRCFLMMWLERWHEETPDWHF